MQVHHNIEKFEIRNTVITIGVFDGVHKGHKSVIERIVEIAKKDKRETIVFTFWPHPRMVLQPENHNLILLNSINEKIALFNSTGIDHLVIYPFTQEFSRLSSCEFIEQILVNKLNVSTLVIGYNHHFGHKRQGTFEDIVNCAEEFRFSIEKLEPYYIDKVEISSTLVRNLLISGDLTKANQYLGYHYFLSGEIIEGSKLGREIGFPTANILPEHQYKLIPKDGVYAVRIEYHDQWYNGMLNIGIKPTVNSDNKKSVEVHIFKFDKFIYGEKITVHFTKRIRDEKKFENLEALKNQLLLDKKTVEKILSVY